VKIVDRKDHENFYIHERKMDAPAVEWWSSTYEALEDGECLIDDPTLSRLLHLKGKKAISMEETVDAMVRA
jgi:hypothetical protein